MGTLRVTKAVVEPLLASQEGNLATISDMEKALEDAKKQLADQAVTELLKRLGPEDGKPEPCPKCKKLVRVNKKAVRRTFEAMSGQHSITRNYHYCDDCEAGFYPRDMQIGLPPDGEVTYELERCMLDLAVNSTYRECVERFRMHYGRSFSENLFRKVVERVGKRMGEADDCTLYSIAAPPPPGSTHSYERLTVFMDGCMLPSLGGVWREAKLAVFVRNDETTACRYVAHWGDQKGFEAKLDAALVAERAVRYRELVWVADGAKGNWTLSYRLSLGDTFTEILDWIHAVENGVECGRALLGERDPNLPVWKSRVEELLGRGEVEQLISELMDCMELATDDQLEAINTIVGYYRNNAGRMNYPDYRRRGLPIGSGRAESGHRHVLQCRMKLAGQHWSDEHGKRMVELRGLYKTTGAERLYDTINRGFLRTKLRKPKACLEREPAARRMPLRAVS